MFSHLPIPTGVAYALEALPLKKFEDFGLPEDLSYAGIVLPKDGRHCLVIGPKFWALRPELQAFVLLHEYTHLAFGHPLQASIHELNPIGWNIATDAWINEIHPHHLTKELNGILYKELREGMPAKPPTADCPQGIPAREPIPTLPEWLIDPLSIYHLLKEHFEKLGGANGMDTMVVEPLDKDREGTAGLEVLKARATLRRAAKDNPELQRIVEELSATYKGSTGVYKDVKVADWLEGIYKSLERLARQKQGDLVRRRGWRRPGRFPGLPGIARRPSLHVLIALDVSGSTSNWWEDIIAACRGITRYHTVHIACHTDELVFEGTSLPEEVSVNGGTAFKPICEVAKRIRPDCLVWVTDGESMDKPKLPDCPITWVWLPGSNKWNLREGDTQVEYQSCSSS